MKWPQFTFTHFVFSNWAQLGLLLFASFLCIPFCFKHVDKKRNIRSLSPADYAISGNILRSEIEDKVRHLHVHGSLEAMKETVRDTVRHCNRVSTFKALVSFVFIFKFFFLFTIKTTSWITSVLYCLNPLPIQFWVALDAFIQS